MVRIKAIGRVNNIALALAKRMKKIVWVGNQNWAIGSALFLYTDDIERRFKKQMTKRVKNKDVHFWRIIWGKCYFFFKIYMAISGI